jgi:hypothetical protein
VVGVVCGQPSAVAVTIEIATSVALRIPRMMDEPAPTGNACSAAQGG